ncbi:MAG: hypothetical protein OEY38_17550 [Gammaproteobacteria bacterium]|nr:hypothetical protein [Gammaproteobacteria bacterium]
MQKTIKQTDITSLQSSQLRQAEYVGVDAQQVLVKIDNEIYPIRHCAGRVIADGVLAKLEPGDWLVVMFDAVQPEQSLLLDRVYNLQEIELNPFKKEKAKLKTEIMVDEKLLSLEAMEQLSLRCGDSAIILDKNGKITIRGKNLISHSEGMNRIKGGAVNIN